MGRWVGAHLFFAKIAIAESFERGGDPVLSPVGRCGVCVALLKGRSSEVFQI